MITKGLSFAQLGLGDFSKPMHWSLLCFALEPIELPFILSGVCSPSEANYCSNPFEVSSKICLHKNEFLPELNTLVLEKPHV